MSIKEHLRSREGIPLEEAGVIGARHNYINYACAPNLDYDFEDNVIADRDVAAGES